MRSLLFLSWFAAVSIPLIACGGVPDWARYDDGTPIRAEEEAEAALVLDSFDSDTSLLALIQLHRGEDVCAACTLERDIDAERAAIRHFLKRPQPPWALERAERKLKLLDRYREEHPFNNEKCTPCLY
jgi:hypothetical protein